MKRFHMAMLVSQTRPVTVKLSCLNAFFCRNKYAQLLVTWAKTRYRQIRSILTLLPRHLSIDVICPFANTFLC